MTIDQLGRPVASQAPGLAPETMVFDERGRIEAVRTGEAGPDQREVTFTYDPRSNLQSVTDPLGRTVSFEYDDAGRVVKQTLPGLREVVFAYEANGNVTSLTPPGQPAHSFTYNEVNLVTSYEPPALADVSEPATTYSYNLDQQLTGVSRPDGLVISLGYDAGGRLSTITFSRGVITLTYDAVTGQLAGITAPGGQDLAFSYTPRPMGWGTQRLA